jgi:hypothetical protein
MLGNTKITTVFVQFNLSEAVAHLLNIIVACRYKRTNKMKDFQNDHTYLYIDCFTNTVISCQTSAIGLG